MITANGVRKVYGSRTKVEALRGVDVRIEAGEFVAVVGPSGSGKTTLLNCLAGLESVDDGQVVVEGQDLAALSDDARSDWRARRAGFVFQAFNLLPVLSAVENVEVPLNLSGVRSRHARRRAMEALEVVGLADRAQHRPDELSGGEQQRVAVARAVVHEPAVVWADEPTGSLDTETGLQVMDLLGGLNAQGRTIVMITHDQDLARRTQRMVWMRDGLIQGDPVGQPLVAAAAF
jgi:putative ABC transport system ATP-binding protein